MKARILAPVEDYMGISASVAFADGKAEADISESQLEYFESAGYTVEILDKPAKAEKAPKADKPAKAEKAPKADKPAKAED